VFPGLVLLNYGAEGLGGSDESWPYYMLGAAAVSLAFQLGAVIRHNRSLESLAERPAQQDATGVMKRPDGGSLPV
jgi:hypothetical protein